MNLYLSLGVIAVAGAIGAWEIAQKRKKSKRTTSIPETQPDEVKEGVENASIWPGINIKDDLADLTIVDWLKTHGPDPELWHFLAVFTVPDKRNSELYAWLVEQDQLDAASAAFLFHSLEGWGMLGYVKGEAPYADASDHDNFLTVKRIADRFEKNEFSAPNYTVIRREDDGNRDAYEQMVRQSEQRFGKALFKVPEQIFDYKTRTLINPKFHYSDYHYNPYGRAVENILQLTDTQLINLIDRY